MFAGYTLYKAVWKDRIKAELKGSDPLLSHLGKTKKA
jgi:hypothetical protein